MKTVTLITTGGTIASVPTGGSVNAALAGARLMQSLHDRPEGITCHIEDFEARGSYAMDLPTVHRLCQKIEAVLADDTVAGVVVSHGTDTMEESALLADLLVASPKPVIFTGAQRHAGEPDSDGPRNLADAIRCAAADALRGYGTMIVFEGEIHAARNVTKTHTSRVDSFRSPGLGKLGDVDRGKIYLSRSPRPRLNLRAPRLEERVELMLLGLGTSPRYLDFCQAEGAAGIVIAGFGRGNAPRGFAEAIARLSEARIPVVITSRCPEGRTAAIYGGDSGAVTLRDAGAILGGDLSPIKARLLLSVLLGGGASLADIASTIEKSVA